MLIHSTSYCRVRLVEKSDVYDMHFTLFDKTCRCRLSNVRPSRFLEVDHQQQKTLYAMSTVWHVITLLSFPCCDFFPFLPLLFQIEPKATVPKVPPKPSVRPALRSITPPKPQTTVHMSSYFVFRYCLKYLMRSNGKCCFDGTNLFRCMFQIFLISGN